MKFTREKKTRRNDTGERNSGRFGRKDSSKRFGRGDSSKRFGGGFGRRSRDTEMHEVTCDKCKKKCEVPFKPTGDKPVYCSDCFRKDSKDKSGQSAKELEQINEKLDKILAVLENE